MVLRSAPPRLLAGAAALALLPFPAAAQEHEGHDVHAGHSAQIVTPLTMRPDYREGCFSFGAVLDDGSHIDGMKCNIASGSGTARIPAADGGHDGLHFDLGGDWMAMLHGHAWAVHTDQSGPRGDDKTYVQSMAMAMLEKRTGWGRMQIKTMMSLEPLMANRGYPNLFATGETAGGAALVDRQHPHDLFMELSGRVDVDVSATGRVYLYGGPVGEPALGPSAFLHRGSARYNPEAPITHHWFDATHISYGVATLGYAAPRWQVEASLFTGREPDEARWNIEKPRLDSWSVRASWSPTPQWVAQASHGFLKQPETLHPGQDERRTTASIQYAGERDGLSAMLAFSAKDRDPGPTMTAWLAEANWAVSDRDNLFARIENVRNDELFPDHADPLHDRAFRVTKLQAGYARRIPLGEAVNLALGGSVAAFAKPDALDAAYGKSPIGATVFARFSIGR
jgi:hypothetical protein